MISVLRLESSGPERLSKFPNEPQLMRGGSVALNHGSLSPELARLTIVMLLSRILQGLWQKLEQWCGVFYLSFIRICSNPVVFQS